MQQDLFTIIIPVYNAEKYLHKCINSVLSQKYKNFELILVDDGSTDNSGKICDEFAKKDSRIRVIHQKNAGPGAARNAALDIMNGKYFSFVDSDDYISPLYISEIILAFKDYDAQIVDIGLVVMCPKCNSFTNGGTHVVVFNGKDELIRDHFSENRQLWNTMTTKAFLTDKFKNYRFSSFFCGEDSEFILNTFSNCEKLVKTNKFLYVYRAYHESITRKKINSKHFDIVDVSLRDMQFCECSGVEIDSWEYIINNFINSCYSLMKRVALESSKENFVLELDNIKSVYYKVSEIARRHNVNITKQLIDDIDNFGNWANEYINKNRFEITISKLRHIVHNILAFIKTKINYEYTFR